MMKIFQLCLMLTLFIASNAVFADSRIRHYEAMKPQSKAQSIEILHENIAKIDKLLSANQQLSDNNLEEIHQISYRLESAGDYLNKNYQDNNVEDMQKYIKAIHDFSEEHQAKETIEAFEQLKSQFKQVILR